MVVVLLQNDSALFATSLVSQYIRLFGFRQLLMQLLQVFRPGIMDFYPLSGQRVAESNPLSMQGLPGDPVRAAAVQSVPQQRVANMAEVDADLMRPARFQLQTHQGCLGIALSEPYMSNGVLSCRGYPSSLLMMAVLADRQVDDRQLRRDLPLYKSRVTARDSLMTHILIQLQLSPVIFGIYNWT